MISFEDDGILGAEIIRRQFVGSPHQALVGMGKELDEGKLLSESNSIRCEVVAPHLIEQSAVVVVEETNIGEEG